MFISLEAPEDLIIQNVMTFVRVNLFENVLPLISYTDFNDSFLHYALTHGLSEMDDDIRDMNFRHPNVKNHLQIALRWNMQESLHDTLGQGHSMLFCNYIYENMPREEEAYFEHLKMQKGLMKPDLSFVFVQEEDLFRSKSMYGYDPSILVLNQELLSGDEENLTLLKIISQRIGEYQDALAFHNQEIKYF